MSLWASIYFETFMALWRVVCIFVNEEREKKLAFDALKNSVRFKTAE